MPTDDSMRSRVPGSRLKLWFLLAGNRWAIAGLLLATVFVVLAAIVAIDPAPLDRSIAASDPAETLFQAMITSIVTGVTLVVTINQVVLSQELGAVGDQRQRMEAALEFRDDVADDLGVPASPPEPSAFLGALLNATADRARELRNAAATSPDSEAREAVERYVDGIVENAEEVCGTLEDAEFGSFDVIQAALDFNYSLKIWEGKRIQGRYVSDTGRGESGREGDDGEGDGDETGGDEGSGEEVDADERSGEEVDTDEGSGDAVLSDDASAALDDVVTLLERFGPAREHVKTLYFQWALTDLSRAMLYSSVPALVITIAGLLTLDNAGTVGGETLGVANQSWVVVLAATVALTPFAILLSYVVRIATVAKHTLAMGPFVLRDADRPGDEGPDGR